MEQQVSEAALAMVRPTTDSVTRAAASNFLEQWNKTAEAWTVYGKWLSSFSHHAGTNNTETVGTQLLCLTLLQAKIRREVPRGTNNASVNAAIHSQLLSLLQSNAYSPQLQRPLCVCTAALAVRCDRLQEMVSLCQAATSITPIVALRLLACLPAEVEACQDLTTPQVIETLFPCMEVVLDTIRRALASPDTMHPALEALRNWAQPCDVTLSHLNSPTCGGTEALFPLLIQILSQAQPENVVVSACRALTEAILVPTDTGTPVREGVVATMVHAIGSGFVVAPFQALRENNDDACHALSTLVSTLVTEEVDYVTSQPAEPLLVLLLQLLAHPSVPVTIPVLECWLTVQEVPTSERHNHWKVPLYSKVVEGLAIRVAYPSSFTDWASELDLDSQEFGELRRMVTDVLVSCYFLLRVEFLRGMATRCCSQDWTQSEAAMYCLCCVAREVCARVKARGGGTSVRADRDATAQQLLQLVQHFLEHSSSDHFHPLVRRRVASFVGAYGPAWSVHCAPEAVLQLLAFLRAGGAMTEEAARATRSIHVTCSNKLLLDGSCGGALLSSIKETMGAALSTDDESIMVPVAEGSTRLLIQMRDKSVVRQYLRNTIIVPLMEQADDAATVVAAQNVNSDAASVSLAKYLHLLQTIVKFCDTPPNDGEPHILSETVIILWPFLDKITQQCGQYEDVLSKVLAVHGQLLNTVPDLVAPTFSSTMKFVVEVFERTKLPSTLDYIAGAVEAFIPFDEASRGSFQNLLGHISAIVVSHATTEKSPHECALLIRSFFAMNQRYMLFSPSTLVTCRNFPAIISLAVECLSACRGERESVRATLNFLTHLFGWRSLRLSSSSSEALESLAGTIDGQLVKHGEAVTKACIDGLAGGPQMLWPAMSDCLFAITMRIAGSTVAGPVIEETTIAHQWLFTALSSSTGSNGDSLSTETSRQVVQILVELSREGQKSKPKAKMLLTDFAKICKGEMTTDALLTYSLH